MPAHRLSGAQREKRVLAAREIPLHHVLIVPFVVLRGELESELGVLAFARDAILADNK